MQKDYQKPIFITLVVIAVSLVLLVGITGYREYAQYNKKSAVEKYISKVVERYNKRRGTVPDLKAPSKPKRSYTKKVERDTTRKLEHHNKTTNFDSTGESWSISHLEPHLDNLKQVLQRLFIVNMTVQILNHLDE